MSQTKNAVSRSQKLTLASLLITGLLIAGSTLGFSANKTETIDATAMGTSTQMGSEFSVTLNIDDYSTQADKQILVEAFQKGGDKGLVNALSKMKAAGHIEVTGTLGYDCSYIQMIPTPTGRKIRFVTNRPLRFGEVYWDTRSTDYNLTAGEFDLNDTDKSKSTGKLYPAAELVIDKQGELQMNLIGNPYNLVNVLDWKGARGIGIDRGYAAAPIRSAGAVGRATSPGARRHLSPLAGRGRPSGARSGEGDSPRVENSMR